MPTPLSASIARFVARCFLFALLIAPAAALDEKLVPSVVGMTPKDALAKLESEGFSTFLLRLDGVETPRAEIESARSVAHWTAPPEWELADTTAVLEVGFETKVRVANHVGQTGGDAKDAAARIGYVLCEGDPSASTPIPDGDTRVVDSYHSSSPPPGTLVSVGAYVGVILVPPSSSMPGGTGAMVVVGVICAVVGAAAGAAISKMSSSKA
jgi:hypothetical protein